jgi:prepilin-type N-terminal cleavage/methylation domain-containing protein
MITRTRRPAFTLLEMILAIAMVAMLSGTLYMSLNVAFKARDSAHAAVGPMRQASVAMDLIRQDLESVPPPSPTPTDTTTAPLLLNGPFYGGIQQIGTGGSPTSVLDFFSIGRDTVLPAAQNLPQPLSEGVRRIAFLVRTDLQPQGPPVLVRRITRNLLSQAQQEPEEEILCRGVRGFVVRYYDGVEWLEEWDSTTLGDVLPMAVEITLEMDKSPGQTQSPWLTPAQSEPYRITRVFPLPCAKPVDLTQSGGLP